MERKFNIAGSSIHQAITNNDLVITMEALLLSIAMAAVIGTLILNYKGFVRLTAALFVAVCCIPSLALFAVFIPAFGLGNKTALIVTCII